MATKTTPVQIEKHEEVPIAAVDDIVKVRQRVRDWAVSAGFSLVDQTKLVTAASELARNTLLYGLGGYMRIELLANEARRGLRMIFHDTGPGIADVQLALRDGYSTGSGLGLGLGGAKRLSQDFSIESSPGQGTRVVIARWK
jgi:serine/threonine-protein kinase RsbT